jgi:hypothetical protein
MTPEDFIWFWQSKDFIFWESGRFHAINGYRHIITSVLYAEELLLFQTGYEKGIKEPLL